MKHDTLTLKRTMDTIKIEQNQFQILESFIEHVCESRHIYNYIGAISVTMENVMSLAKCNAEITVSSYKDGICFCINTENNSFDFNAFAAALSSENEQIFIISSLSDKAEVSNDGKTLSLYFRIEGIEEELFVDRKQKINTYSLQKVKVLN